MRVHFRKVFVEIVWLASCMLLVCILTGMSFNIFDNSSSLDIRLHDSYYVLSVWSVWMPVVFIVYMIKEAFNGYRNRISVFVIIAVGITLLLGLLGYYLQIKDVYEKLSLERDLKNSVIPQLSYETYENSMNYSLSLMTKVMFVIACIILMCIVFVIYRQFNKRIRG